MAPAPRSPMPSLQGHRKGWLSMTWDMPPFGQTVRTLREDAGKTMGDLARALDVSVTYVSDIERGQRPPPSAETVDAIAKFLGVDSLGLHRLAGEARGVFHIRTESLPNAARWFFAEITSGKTYPDEFWGELSKLAAGYQR